MNITTPPPGAPCHVLLHAACWSLLVLIELLVVVELCLSLKRFLVAEVMAGTSHTHPSCNPLTV